MPSRDDALGQRLLATFQVEAREHIAAIASALVELEKAPAPETVRNVLDATFRSVHSLKGAARAVDAGDIEKPCHAMEAVFAALKRKEVSPSPELFDLLHRTVDALAQMLENIVSGSPDAEKPRASELTQSLRQALAGMIPERRNGSSSETSENEPPAPAAPPEAAGKRNVPETVRVATNKLDAVLRQAEEMLSVKQSSARHMARLREMRTAPAEWRKKWTRLSPDVRLVRRSLQGAPGRKEAAFSQAPLERIVEFLDWSAHFVEGIETDLSEVGHAAAHDQRAVGTMVDNLLDEMKKVVMQPFSTLLDVFPRFIRELSREQGKETALLIHGGDIEIDRRILEEMKDPLIHLIRNGIDHGIETPDERVRLGKPPGATIRLGISARQGNNVELLVADDGAGIDAAKVRGAAERLHLLPPEKGEASDDREALALIFRSGVSTNRIVTDISGRGLGLAIVKEKVEKLGGTLSVETERGRGTTFRILLPMTLARFHGVVVRAGGRLFVLPTGSVERVLRVKADEIKTVENRETIALAGEAVSLARLHETLNLPGKAAAASSKILQVIVVASGRQRVAFVVDEILHEQEVLVKTLGPQLVRVRNIAGATVLENGRVVLILHVPDVIQSAVRMSGPGASAAPAPEKAAETPRKPVLVVEDSITSRTLLKSILESAGYDVTTAVDGLEALTCLRSGEFDLVVSDVDMPRLNGFGLTEKIRADKRFSALPVILVTALDSREDRERGIDVGANAYIVKSSFDQSNLLEVVRRLI